jgi:alpha-tubulin suppressor-like RCC1 family protein
VGDGILLNGMHTEQGRVMSFLTLKKNKVLVSLLLASSSAFTVVAACQVVDKSDYTFADADGGVGEGGNAGDGNTGCTDADFQCTEAGVLLACEGGVFQAEEDGTPCESAALCDAARGECRECSPGEFRCTDEKLEQCNLEGTAYELTSTCSDADACHVSTNRQRGYCTLCDSGDPVCDPIVVLTAGVSGAGGPQAATELRECNDDGNGTVLTEICNFENPICDAVAGACTSCIAGETRCLEGKIQTCNEAGSAWEEDEDCGTVALCNPMGEMGPECIAPDCDIADDPSCDSAGKIEGCGLDGQPFEIVDCPTQARCDDVERRCTDCEPGTWSCGGGGTLIQWCGTGGASDDYIARNPMRGQLVTFTTCTSGCTGGANYSCSGTYGLNYCNIDPGGGYNYPYYYDVAGSYMQCPAGSACVGSDETPFCTELCKPDASWCDSDNVLHTCNSDGDGIDSSQECGNGFCAAWLQTCLPARPGDRFCGANGVLGRVETDGAVTELDQCAGPEACDPDRGCLVGGCRAGTTVCDGANVMECTDGVNMASADEECSSAARCSPGIGCTEAIAIAAGDAHTCAIFASSDAEDGDAGFVKCWGANESGQLGNGSSILGDSAEARYVVRYGDDSDKPPIATPSATSLCAGKDFTCATIDTADGSRVVCWGSNAKGQLGNNTEDVGPNNYAELLVVSDEGPIAGESVACGADFACAVGADGSTWCWGANDSGQVGNGASGDPVLAAELIDGHAFVSVAAGGHQACGVKEDGSVFCWGEGGGGAEGANAPAELDGVTAVADIAPALGRDFGIITSTEANPFAFGANDFGQLATGDTTDAPAPVAAGDLNSDEIDNLFSGATSAHACARIGSTLVCWGANMFGQVGNDTTDPALSPSQALDGSGNSTKLRPGSHSAAVGTRHTCAINATGTVLCWGANHRGQLGTDAAGPVTVPSESY